MHLVLTVAIPTLDAGPEFARVLRAIADQKLDEAVELLICDSGSCDATVTSARDYGARVIEITRREFSHGGTRNRLMEEAVGDYVAFLTQDAVPARTDWLARLRAGFEISEDVGLVFGPYQPRRDASPMVTRELISWFASFAPEGDSRIDRLADGERELRPADLFGHRGYFTDVNGCVSRSAWERVPFREIGYAEDHLLALDMLRAGFAKTFVPDAPVIHSHEYTGAQWLRRSFDETRAIREIYGIAPAGAPRAAWRNLRGNVGADWKAGGRRPGALAASLYHHSARTVGTVLGARAEHLPTSLTARMSLEGRR